MSRTACCFVALGISFAAFAAACGDDDGGGGTGGNGGGGGTGGGGGSAGTANTAGEGGSSAGEAGSGNAGSGNAGTGNAGSGNAGSGNAGSGNAGSGNAGAGGSGTVVDTDAGTDSGTGDEPDSGVVVDAGHSTPVDSGVNGDCPNFTTTTALTEPQNSQPITIVRVTFNGNGTANVVLRSADSTDVGGFTLGDIAALCTGPDDGDCVDPSDFGATGLLALNAEVTLPNVPGLLAAEGEIALTTGGTGLPSDVTTTTLAYVAWGADFVSEAPSGGGGLTSWEDRAVLDTFWTAGNRIPLTGTQNTFVCGGDTSLAASFSVCTADEF